MQTEFPLQHDVRSLFQWVAQKRQTGAVTLTFDDVRAAMQLATDEELTEILDELKNCPYLPCPVIESIRRVDEAQTLLTLHKHAHTAWLSYVELERQHLYP